MRDKKTYQEVISMLQEHKYVAPNQWDMISDELSLIDQMSQLKQYEVKKDLWVGIEKALDDDQVAEIIKPRLNILKEIWPFAVLFLATTLIISIYLYKRTQAETQHFVYSSEIETLETSLDVPSEDVLNYELAQEFIDSNKFLFSENSLNEFSNELQKLDEAIAETKSVQEQYGLDESMIKLLSKMEREKATLIKSMINRT